MASPAIGTGPPWQRRRRTTHASTHRLERRLGGRCANIYQRHVQLIQLRKNQAFKHLSVSRVVGGGGGAGGEGFDYSGGAHLLSKSGWRIHQPCYEHCSIQSTLFRGLGSGQNEACRRAA